MKKALLVVLVIGSLPALFLLSLPIEDHSFNKPFDPKAPHFVLLVWPDHVEIRTVGSIAEVSPRPPDAGYVFCVPPDRVHWTEEQVRRTPPPDPEDRDSVWLFRVQQAEHGRQRIQLEAWGKDEFSGMVYTATADEIFPLKRRRGGIGNAVVFGMVDFAVWCGIWISVMLVQRRKVRHPKQVPGG